MLIAATSERLPGRRRHPGILPKLFYAASNKSGHFLIVNRMQRPTNRDIFYLLIAAFLLSSSRSRLLQKGKLKGLEFINGTVTNHCFFCRSLRSFSNEHIRIFILGSDLFHIDGIPLRPNEAPRTAGNSRSLSFVQIWYELLKNALTGFTI